MNGAGLQDIYTTSAFNNFTINKTTGSATLSSTVAVNGALNFVAGTLDLRTLTLTASGTATYTAGTINNGRVVSSGPAVTFAGTVFGASVNAASDALYLNGSTFNNMATFIKTGVADIVCAGGNTFNSTTVIGNNGSGLLRLGAIMADDFNGDVSFSESSSGHLEPSYAANSTFAGNLTVSGSSAMVFGAGSGMAIFDGSNAQKIDKTGIANPVFNRMQVNKSAGNITLNTEIDIYKSLAFIQQNIISSATNPLVLEDSATCSGTSHISHVVGPVKKIGNEAFVFPIGNSDYFRPVSISAPTLATDQFIAEYIAADPGLLHSSNNKATTLNHISSSEYWLLERTNGNSNVAVALSWDANSYGVTDLSGLKVAHWNGSTWEDLGNGGTTGNLAAGTIVSFAPVTSFSPFTLSSSSAGNPLPIELLSFTAQPSEDFVDVLWSTSVEINNDHFVVERSKDGISFSEVAETKGAGNSTSLLKYSYIDEAPLIGTSYYRLKQIDFDGAFTYSPIRSVNFVSNKQIELSVYPNPVSGNEFKITIIGIEQQNDAITIIDLIGNIIFKGVINTGNIDQEIFIDKQITPGTYLIRITGQYNDSQAKIIVI